MKEQKVFCVMKRNEGFRNRTDTMRLHLFSLIIYSRFPCSRKETNRDKARLISRGTNFPFSNANTCFSVHYNCFICFLSSFQGKTKMENEF